MKSSSSTYNELGKKRIARKELKLMSIPQCKENVVNKENENPELINSIKKSTFKAHERDVKECQQNPFVIPDTMKTFSGPKKPTKPKPDPFITKETRTIFDIDPFYFEIVKGRPIRPTHDVKVYMRNIRDITLFKADAAYLKEAIYLLDTKLFTEKVQYRDVRRLYDKCVINFVRFIKEGYKEVKILQTQNDQNAIDLADINDQLEATSIQYVKLRNLVSSISYNFETRAVYARFLNSFAPDWWKQEYGTNTESSHIPFDEFGNIAQASLSSIDEFKASIAKRQKYPYLFFMDAKEMMFIFDTISRQCLNYILIDVQTSSVRKAVLKRRDILKADIVDSIEEMNEIIKIFEEDITFYEEKEIAYQNAFFKIISTEFYDLFASYESAKLFTCVQYVNTKIFDNPEDPKDSVVTLMRQLESLYYSLSSALDDLDQKFVKMATRTSFAEDIKALKRAHKAKRALKECDILKKSLYASFEPPRKMQTSQLKNMARNTNKLKEGKGGRIIIN